MNLNVILSLSKDLPHVTASFDIIRTTWENSEQILRLRSASLRMTISCHFFPFQMLR